jgi:hypothetical protein
MNGCSLVSSIFISVAKLAGVEAHQHKTFAIEENFLDDKSNGFDIKS